MSNRICLLFILLLGWGVFHAAQAQYSAKIDSLKQLIQTNLSDCERADALGHLGSVMVKLGNYPKAKELYQQSLEISQPICYRKGERNALGTIGIIHNFQGDHCKALEYHLRSLKISEEIGGKRGIASDYNRIGGVYYDQEDYPKALKYWFQSLKILREVGYRSAAIYSNIGEAYYFQGDYSKALEYQFQSLKIDKETGRKEGIGYSYVNIGRVYIQLDSFPQAVGYIQKGLDLTRDERIRAQTLTILGTAYQAQKSFDKAISCIQEGLALARKIGNAQEIRSSAKALAQAYEATGQYRLAYKTHVLFKQMSDSLINEKNSKKLTQQAMQFKFDKEKAIMRAESESNAMQQQQEIQQRNYIIYTASAGMLVLLALVLVVYRSANQQTKANTLLAKQNTDISQQKNEIQQQSEEISAQRDSLEVSYKNVRMLSEVGKEITHHISVEEIIDTVYVEVNKLMPAEGFGIGVYNAKENRIDFPGYIEKGEKLPFHWDALGDDDSLSDYCFKHSKELFIREYDLEVGEYIAHPAIKEGEKPESLLFLPLLAQGKPVGNITVQSFAKNAYTENHLDIFRNIATYVAIALDNASAYEKLDTEKEKVEVERKKSESLLLNILPAQIALELKEKGYAEPRVHEEVTVLFTDFKGFTQSTTSMRHDILINALDECFQKFDKIMERHGLEKIKTIGDSYMAVSGLPASDPEHAEKAVRASLEIRDFIKRWQRRHRRSGFDFDPWEIRIGLHSGQVVAGVVGKKKFAYDIWGDTVNVASRMESNGHPAKVNISAVTKQLLESRPPGQWAFEYRGEVQAKGKGMMRMYFVEKAKALDNSLK